jgi:prepilin-type N-terminal cleavage/methylation domain-containing protein
MRPRPSSSSSARGYTAVEVLMAMTIMTIGAAAVMSMQKASVQGNLDARETDLANSIARMWVERLQRDAMQWTQPNNQNPSLNNFAQAKLLSSPAYGAWGVPKWEMGSSPETMSYAFDILGRDIPAAQIGSSNAADPETVFCVNYRLQWLVPQTLPVEPGLIRADVRVLWLRGLYNVPTALRGWCNEQSGIMTQDIPDNGAPANTGPYFHSLYVTTTIRQGAQ